MNNSERSLPLQCADLILSGGALIALFAGFYLMWRHGLSINRQASTGYLLAVPVVAAMLLAVSLKLRPGLRLQVAAGLLVIGAVAYGAEIFFYAPEKPGWIGVNDKNKEEVVRLAKQFGVEFDTRSEEKVIGALRAKNVEAVPVIFTGASVLRVHEEESLRSAARLGRAELIPLGGISNKLTVMCNQSGQYVTYLSDERGFQNPPGLWSTDALEIAALGNSFTQGYCVPPARNFVSLIRDRYPSTLNLGMAGNGPLLMLAGIKEFLQRYRPEKVLWFYFEGNQLSDLQREKKNPILMRYLENDFRQSLNDRQDEIDRALVRRLEARKSVARSEAPAGPMLGNLGGRLLRVVKLTDARRKLGMLYGTDDPNGLAADIGENIRLFNTILTEARNTVRAWGGTLYFVYLPSWERYANHNPGITGKQRSRILELVAAMNLPLIDVQTAFEAEGDPVALFPFRRMYHYNEAGHRIVAQEVVKALSARS